MGMTIKEILDKENITISKFASDFNLSRNTVPQYIKLFEEGKKIPKEKYDLVFNRLFKEYKHDSFEMDYYYLKRLINRDRLNGTIDLSPEKTDVIMNLFRDMSDAYQNDLINENALFLMNMIISNYSKDNVVKSFCGYMRFFNNSKPEDYYNLSDDEKVIYTNYFKLFTMQTQGLLKLDIEIQKLFLSRMEEINKFKKMSKNQ